MDSGKRCDLLPGENMNQEAALEMVYKKLKRLESKISGLEKKFVPEEKISQKEATKK